MIDHAAARDAFATSLDFALEPAERDELDAHLRECTACRSFAASMRGDAAILRDLDFGPVPIAVRANVAIAAERDRRGGAVARGVLLAAAGALLLVAIGGGVLGVGGGRQGSVVPGPSGEPGPTGARGPGGVAAANDQITWKTEVVALTAREFSIVAGGRTFRAATPKVAINSDPGTATYRTLEATWQENGVEMRLNLYFGGDATASWVSEVRIYNGAAQGAWLYARGIFFKTPLGATWTGDRDIAMTDVDGVGGTPAGVHLAGVTLTTNPSNLGPSGPGNGPILAPAADAFLPGGKLYCAGILQLAPQEAERRLLALGFKVSWRNQVTGETSDRATDGVITVGPFVGTSGELMLFVMPKGNPSANPIPFPADCPTVDPNVTPPPPVP